MRIPKPHVVLPVAVLVVGALITAGLVVGRKPVQRVARVTPPPVVRVLAAEPVETRLDVESQGQVTPRTATEIVAQVAGQIVEVSPGLVNGGAFDRGETLAVIDPTDFRFALKSAEAGKARAELGLAREEKEAAIALRDWEALGGSGTPDPLVLRGPQLAEARAAASAAEASVEKARADLDRTRVRVPYPGRVREKLVDVGRYVSPGTPIARVYATDAVEVRLPVPADEIGFLDFPFGAAAVPDGPRVLLRARLGTGLSEWVGRVVRTEGEVDPRTRMVNVVARVEDPYGKGAAADGNPLAVGLFVEARIEGRTARDVVVIPRSALRGKSGVLVVDAEDRLRPRQVEVVRVDRERAVIGAGLEAGERVCLSAIEVAVDGMQVRVQEGAAE
jgi:RND family efflux transporter MFP subunit